MHNSCLLMSKFDFAWASLLSSDSLDFFFLLSLEACRIIDLPQYPHLLFLFLYMRNVFFVSYLIP